MDKNSEALIDLKANPLKKYSPSNMSFDDLRAELERQLETKKDIVVSDKNVKAWVLQDDISLEVSKMGDFPMTDICHAHCSQNLNIPKKYYDRMRQETPDLLAENINTWLQKSKNLNVIRTMDEKAYAWVSGGYGFYDNYPFLIAIANAVYQMGGCILSSLSRRQTNDSKGVSQRYGARTSDSATRHGVSRYFL